MTHTTFDRVLAEAKTLSPDEQRQLRDYLEAWLSTLSTPMTEAEFEQQLMAQGILSNVPPPHHRCYALSAAHADSGARPALVGDHH